MNLYELTETARQLQELLESGEIDEQTFADTLEGLEIDTKIENICKVIRNLDAQAKQFKEEKQRLEARQKAAENGVKRLKDSLTNTLLTLNSKSVQAGLFKVTLSSSDRVCVVDPTKIPEQFMIQQEPKIDVSGIGKAIKNGEEVSGATVTKNPYVLIR